jgi:type II secretory pathway component PulF
MPTFAVNVIDSAGRRRWLHEEAPDEAYLRERLRLRGLWVVRVVPAPTDRRFARLVLPVGEFIALLNQLELQLRAGVTADVALAQLAEDAPAGRLRTLLAEIHREVAQGVSIHAACSRFPRQFPAHVAAIIAAGEASARLPEALRDLAAHLAGMDAIRRTATRTLYYPTIVLAATTALVAFLLGGVVPQFAGIFASLNLSLPPLTLALIRLSGWLVAYGPGLAAGLVLIGAGTALVTRTPAGQLWRDTWLLRIPVFGETLRCLATARFAALTRLQHDAGIPILESLATGAKLTGNAALARDLLIAREGVAAGRPLHAALPPRHHFPAFLRPALKAGETTGQLGAALGQVEGYAAARAKETLATALALLEPALLATLTGIVGLIALSFFLPLFSLLGGVNSR